MVDKVQIYKKLWSKNSLEIAYKQVIKMKCARTSYEAGSFSFDGYFKETLEKISLELKNHTFKFKPVRWIRVSTPAGKKRFFGIPSFKDQIVQKSTVNVLEEIYESVFWILVVGFGPKEGFRRL